MADSPNVDGDSVVKLTVFSAGQALQDSVQLLSVEISKAINKISRARIVVMDGDMPGKDFPVSNTDDFKPGTEIKINAGYDQNEETLFQGIIVGHGLKITGANQARLVIECRDKAVGMTIGRKNANFVDSKDSALITTLIGNYNGLTADVATTTTQHKELVQYYCTDWDFMLSRAEINGLVVLVDDGNVSVKGPQTQGSPLLTVTYGEDLMEFHADTDARYQLSAVTGTAWDLKNQAVVESGSIAPQTFNTQGDLDSATLAKVVGPTAFRLQTSVPLDQTALKDWATAQQVKSGLARIQGRMKFQGSAKAKIGELIEIQGVGNRFKGNVYVSGVHHEIAQGNWVTEVEFGLSPEWSIEKPDIMAPSTSGLLPGVNGLQIGVVKKLDGDPDQENKIQVSVPVLQAETEGVWARLASFYGSEGLGAFFIPEIDDEVVLGYFNNDPSHPVILGSLYSSKRTPPYELTADNYMKAIVTKSKMKVEFDDENKIVTILTPGNNTIVISDKDQSIVLQDQNNNKVSLSADGILLDSPKDITVNAKGKITLTAVGELGLSSQADVKVEGMNINNTANAGFVAKGNATAELSASGQTTVKGAMVMIN